MQNGWLHAVWLRRAVPWLTAHTVVKFKTSCRSSRCRVSVRNPISNRRSTCQTLALMHSSHHATYPSPRRRSYKLPPWCSACWPRHQCVTSLECTLKPGVTCARVGVFEYPASGFEWSRVQGCDPEIPTLVDLRRDCGN